jgi:hypothetical protein
MFLYLFAEVAPMQAYRVKATIQKDGKLMVSNLPLQAGEAVEVIILVQSSVVQRQNRYPLRGMPITYINPTEPVTEAEWEAAR